MAGVGRIATLQDLNSLQPAPMPATLLSPGSIPLSTLLGGRKLLHYCVSHQAGSIRTTGLLPNSWCTVTPLSSYVADIWLGLPSRRDYVFVIDPASIQIYQGPGISIGFPADPLRVGGAVEFFLPQGAPPQAILHGDRLEEF